MIKIKKLLKKNNTECFIDYQLLVNMTVSNRMPIPFNLIKLVKLVKLRVMRKFDQYQQSELTSKVTQENNTETFH